MAGEQQDTLATLIALAAVLPMGVPQAVVEHVLPGGPAGAAQQVQRWLGLDSTGRPYLREHSGAWHLSPDVWVDWRVFRDLANPSAEADDPQRLARALALIRGELFTGLAVPPAAQELLRPVADEIRAVVVSTVEREMLRALATADSQRASWALRQGLLLLPREDALWRIQLQL